MRYNMRFKRERRVQQKPEHTLCKCGKRACEYFGPARGWQCAKTCKVKVSNGLRRKHSRCMECEYKRP